MKNILFVTRSLGFGGAEKMLTFVAGQLQQRGYTCGIVNLNTAADYVNKQQQKVHEGVAVFTAEKPDAKTDGNVHYIREIKKYAKELKADILIGFTGYPNLYAKIVGMLLGIPSIMSERGDPSSAGKGTGLKNGVVWALVNQSRGGVFQTEGARSFYKKGMQRRGVVIPNPIFVNGELPDVAQHEREKSVVSVARLDNHQKRYDVMLDAFKLFSQKHPDYVLKLYGKGDDEEMIRGWVSERALDDKVLFMGLTKQPMQDTCRDGMFLITSDYEGISNSLLEAMAIGLPCVATDHAPGGARLLITDHENGLLAPVRDPEALAKAMCEFVEDPALAEKCGNNAKDVVNRFAPDRIIDLWEAYILKLTK